MIVTDDKVLRQMSKDWEGTVKELDELVKKMESAMKEVNGIGIAAIQIGVPKRIFITAEEGNFIDSDKILLKKNVKFKSNDFSIETENVIFDRNKQTAHSAERSYFKTNNATIISNGFDISEKGNKIVFFGKASIILK